MAGLAVSVDKTDAHYPKKGNYTLRCDTTGEYLDGGFVETVDREFVTEKNSSTTCLILSALRDTQFAFTEDPQLKEKKKYTLLKKGKKIFTFECTSEGFKSESLDVHFTVHKFWDETEKKMLSRVTTPIILIDVNKF